jgi:ATP-dependent RNA helicase RhlE
MSFASLGLSSPLLSALDALGYRLPTPVQAEVIAPLLAGRDALVSAETGSGKTVAFCLPLLQRWLSQASTGLESSAKRPITRPARRVQALVLVPTRELAVQVGDVARALVLRAGLPAKVSVVFGGVSINPQMMGLRGGTDVLVATPGRLLDLVAQRAVDLSSVDALVLDEADRLLDLGFEDELMRILALLPARRQNLFFSATFAPPVEALALRFLNDPLRVIVAPAVLDVHAISQRAIEVDTTRRTPLLRHLLATEAWPRALVFVATKHAAEVVADKLRKAGITAEPFHGELSQGKRAQVLADFKREDLRVVVATDMASRGLDVALLPVVVNYDLPRSATDHVHRIGRTGRAGALGQALSFVTPATEAHFRLIEKRQGQRVPRERVAGFEPLEHAPALQASESRDATGLSTGGVKGRRPSKKDKLRAAAAEVQAQDSNS